MNFLLGFFIGIFISGGKREVSTYSPPDNQWYGQQNYQNLANQFQAQQMQFNQHQLLTPSDKVSDEK